MCVVVVFVKWYVTRYELADPSPPNTSTNNNGEGTVTVTNGGSQRKDDLFPTGAEFPF